MLLHEVEAYDPYTRRKVEVFAEYDAQCQREGVVDFSELLLRCYELLSRNAAIREHYQERFRHILVDEFQDTNPLQYQWLKLLAGGGERRSSPLSDFPPQAEEGQTNRVAMRVRFLRWVTTTSPSMRFAGRTSAT